MRLRRASPLLLLLLPAFAAADLDSPKNGRLQKRDTERLTKEEILELNVAKGQTAGKGKAKFRPQADAADATTTTEEGRKPSTSPKPYVGTDDAPVDGLDGKPHAGPFVDTTPDETTTRRKGAADATTTAKSRPTSLEKFAEASSEDGWSLADIPEKNDGVMNDEARVAPKKGTTGTEGGISEKTKDNTFKGDAEKKPKAPNEAPPLPHSEQERMAAEQGKTQEKSSSKKAAGKGAKGAKGAKAGKDEAKENEKDGDTAKKGGEYGAGGLGLEKPADLPDKPHNIPHPDHKGPGSVEGGPQAREPPVDSNTGNNKWLQDTMPYTEGSSKPPTNARPQPAITSPGTVGDTDWHEWFHSFGLSLTMILFSEIGDKTFLVAALMAMRHDRLLVFTAALAALILMTILSAILGHVLPTLLPKRLTTFAAALLFLVFGARLLREGLAMPADSGVGEEMREVEAELEEKESQTARHSSSAMESGRSEKLPSTSPSSSPRQGLSGLTNLLTLVLSPAWVQTFIMTFLGEWGDRSQIATIAMAAGQDYWWVTLGAITGHACCTGLAVIGGRALAGRVSMRVGKSTAHPLPTHINLYGDR